MSKPAFPTDGESQVGNRVWHFSGLTKREYFAAKAMQGILTNSAFAMKEMDHMAGYATRAADALIEALKDEQD